MWDVIDDCNINNLAKNQVSAVFQSRATPAQKCVTQIYRALYGEAMFVPFAEGHKYGGRDVTKTSVVQFCYWNE